MTIDKAKALMTEAAMATFRGDNDAVGKAEATLAALNELGSKDPRPPAASKTSPCRCAQAPAEIEVVSRKGHA